MWLRGPRRAARGGRGQSRPLGGIGSATRNAGPMRASSRAGSSLQARDAGAGLGYYVRASEWDSLSVLAVAVVVWRAASLASRASCCPCPVVLGMCACLHGFALHLARQRGEPR